MKLFPLACILFLNCLAIHRAAADSLVPNGGFEDGVMGWTSFVPDESQDKSCHFEIDSHTPHSGSNCAILQAADIARFGIGSDAIPVKPGDRYRVSVWYRADASAHVRPKSPGFVVRLGLRQGASDADGGHLFVGPGNRVARVSPADPASDDLPTTWTHIEAVIEIPGGVDTMFPSLFYWWAVGPIYADDFSIEKVDATTAVTPLWQKTPPSPVTK